MAEQLLRNADIEPTAEIIAEGLGISKLDTHEIFMSWYEEVKKEVEG